MSYSFFLDWWNERGSDTGYWPLTHVVNEKTQTDQLTCESALCIRMGIYIYIYIYIYVYVYIYIC